MWKKISFISSCESNKRCLSMPRIVTENVVHSQLRDFDLTHSREAVTSWRHSMTHPNLFSLSQLVDVLERWLFLLLWNFGLLSLKMLSVLYLHDDVTSWRHVMTSKTGCTLSQLVEVLERWFFFCFYSFPACLVWKCYRFGVCIMSWRHDVTSWRHKTHFSYISLSMF